MNWSNTPIETRFRTIDGLSIRFAQSEDRDDHALLLSPWPDSLLAFEPPWSGLAQHTGWAGGSKERPGPAASGCSPEVGSQWPTS